MMFVTKKILCLLLGAVLLAAYAIGDEIAYGSENAAQDTDPNLSLQARAETDDASLIYFLSVTSHRLT